MRIPPFMNQAAAISILALTVSVSLSRPRVGQWRIDHSAAAVMGALLCILLGVLPLANAVTALQFLVRPVITIVSLMVITSIAEQAGVFEYVAHGIARLARENAKTLFTYVFFAGALTGTIFTNDAAVLIFTPLIFRLIEDVQQDNWTTANKMPYYFAVLYVANVAGALVISNPINVIVTRYFGIPFLDYAKWMILPALVSIVVTFVGLRWFFRKQLPDNFRPLHLSDREQNRKTPVAVCGVVLFVTLAAFFSEDFTGVPTWAVAAISACTLLLLHSAINKTGYGPVVRGVGWDAIIFVIGIFLIANSVRTTGAADQIGALIEQVAGSSLSGLSHTVAFIAAGISAVMNNHPTADTMAMVVREFEYSEFDTKILAFSALIGGDLGPKMLPIGSLAALMWFRMLRQRGVDVSYWTYVKIGVPVSLAAILLAVLTLNVEVYIYKALSQ